MRDFYTSFILPRATITFLYVRYIFSSFITSFFSVTCHMIFPAERLILLSQFISYHVVTQYLRSMKARLISRCFLSRLPYTHANADISIQFSYMRYISSRSSVLQKVMRYFCYTKRQKRERRSTLKLNTRYLVCFYVSFSIYLLQWTGSIDIGHSERQRGNAVIVCEHVAHAVMYN